MIDIRTGDALEQLRLMPSDSVHCVVTSPPYFALRDYGVPGQIGLESTLNEFLAKLVAVFAEVRRVLRTDGVCWVNIGDSYSGSWGTQGRDGNADAGLSSNQVAAAPKASGTGSTARFGIPAKNLLGVPWRLAFAMQDDGWYLRSECIWCLSGGVWVYARTQKGDAPVMVKDLVRLNPETVQLWTGERWTRVLGWGSTTDDSEPMEIVLRSGERIGCTGGHLWPTQRGNIAARDLRVGDTLRSCRIPEPDGCERPPFLTDDALWLAGLYLAEGSRNGRARQLSLGADELAWLPRIEAVARHYGGSCTHTLDGGSLSVRLYGAVLHAIIDTYVGGSVAIDKHLRVAAWRLQNDALRLLVTGYLDGDGSDDRANDRWRLGCCRNYALERDLRTAAARLGATLTLKPGTATYQDGESPCFRGEWRWERSGHGNERDRGEVVEIRASRARGFWDIAVEDEPHLFALASGVLTHNCKPNPMPESVTDRPTKAHEQVFLFTKAPRYFYDADAVRVAATGLAPGNLGPDRLSVADPEKGRTRANLHKVVATATANLRTVWTIATEPLREAHFAAFPTELAKRCILAGTSAVGCCSICGAPYERVTTRELVPGPKAAKTFVIDVRDLEADDNDQGSNRQKDGHKPGYVTRVETTGWTPTCECASSVVPCTVLDPFCGAGTTGLVAIGHGRRFVGIELNPRYVEMATRRIRRAVGIHAAAQKAAQ